MKGSKKRARFKVTRLVLAGHGQVNKKQAIFAKQQSSIITLINIKPRATIYTQVQNVWISEQEHLRQFLAGADWFVDNQDDNGGWPSQVRSKQTNNQNVINKRKKNRMSRLNFFLPGHIQSREQKVSRSWRGCPWVVRCNVSGAKFARKQININTKTT